MDVSLLSGGDETDIILLRLLEPTVEMETHRHSRPYLTSILFFPFCPSHTVGGQFGLIVEGFGYHSFRLTEVMAGGAIPVIVVDHYVLVRYQEHCGSVGGDLIRWLVS